MSDNTENKASDKIFNIPKQYIKDFSFEIPNAPEVFIKEFDFDMNINYDVQINQLEATTFEVCLVGNIVARNKKSEENEIIYLVEAKCAAIVEMHNIPEEEMKPLLFIEAPRTIFPELRNLVRNFVSSSGFGDLLLTPVDFVQSYFELEKQNNENSQ